MNRRNFIKSALKAATGFMILPSAVTYARNWKLMASGLVVPRWIPMPSVEWNSEVFTPPQLPLAWYWGAHMFTASDFMKSAAKFGHGVIS